MDLNRPANTDRISLTLTFASMLCWGSGVQGKTTTLARFLAALSIASPVGGLLCTVYSTSLDRSVELVRGAKQYIYWLSDPKNAFPEFQLNPLDRDNERGYIVNNGYAANQVLARPKNPESCRGDAPACCIFDEAGFMSKALWEQFAYPLLQVGDRVFTCATTPPPPNGFFATFVKMVEEKNAIGDDFFYLLNHSLTCADCLEAGDSTDCLHNMSHLPPWKSLVTLHAMMGLVRDSNTFAMEVYGVLGLGNSDYIPAKLVDSAVARARVSAPFHPTHVYVAIDPPSHGISEMGIFAFALNEDGVHVVLGLSSTRMEKCQTSEVQLIVHMMLAGIRAHPLVPESCVMIPIVECNNNEFLSMSLLRCFENYPPTHMPWEADNFPSCISPGIGIWMTRENKQAAIQCVYQAYLDGRVCFSAAVHVADATAINKRARVSTQDELIYKLGAQLKALKDQPDGTVSGKHLGPDDLAISMLIGVYWSMCCRAVFAQHGSLA